MSFDDSSRLESQPTTWRRQDDPEYADDPEFKRFTTQLSDQLFSLTSNVTRLSNQISLLGTKRETERVRERVRDMIEETSSGFKEVGEGLKKVQQWHDLGVRYRPFLTLKGTAKTTKHCCFLQKKTCIRCLLQDCILTSSPPNSHPKNSPKAN